MIAYLDANIVIYYLDNPAYWGARAAARLGALATAGDEWAASDLHRLKCFVGAYKSGSVATLAAFTAFFADPGLRVFPLAAAVCERAARIRAAHHFKPLDSLHLAAAVENGCGLFLTADTQLASFPDVPVEVLT